MIALITDFGLSDVYVGVMKSVIESITPGTVVIDLTHGIPAHDIRSGSFALRGAFPYLPPGSVVVAVVDPEVGTSRLPIAVRAGKSWIIAPNNGLITGITFDQAVVLDKPSAYRAGAISSTFHGRDIFAPAAAHLVRTRDLLEIGSPLELKAVVSLDRPSMNRTDAALTGEVQHIDRFGNIITNITPDVLSVWVLDDAEFEVSCGPDSLPAKRAQTYAEGLGFEGVVFITNSYGLIEIAAANSNAARQFRAVKPGQPISIKRSRESLHDS